MPEDYLAKHFLPGDLVKVDKGTHHIGKHGLIVKIDEDNAIVFCESTNTEFKVSINDLKLSSNTAQETVTEGIFQLEDLVRINGTNNICYVLDLQKHSAKLINFNGEIKIYSLRDITKISVNKSYGIDIKKNPISKEDKVIVKRGHTQRQKRSYSLYI